MKNIFNVRAGTFHTPGHAPDDGNRFSHSGKFINRLNNVTKILALTGVLNNQAEGSSIITDTGKYIFLNLFCTQSEQINVAYIT